MSAQQTSTGPGTRPDASADPSSPPQAQSGGVGGILARLLSLGFVDAFGIWFLFRLVVDGNWFLAVTVLVVTVMINVFYLRENLYPYRWFAPGLALMALMVLYPTAFTFYVAFTNYRDGNLLTQPQALRVLQQRTFVDPEAPAYDWTAYRNEAGERLLWLVSPDGEALIARPDEPFTPAAEAGFEGTDPPENIDGFEQLNQFQALADSELTEINFGEGAEAVRVTSSDALQLQPLYSYNAATDTLVNNETGVEYTAQIGTYTAADGEQLRPGYYVPIGFENFQRMFRQEFFGTGVMFHIFTWTFVHAFLAVFVTFTLGLGLAIVLNHELVPAKKFLRSFLLIPYAIPAFISVLVWRGLLDPNLGVVNELLEALTFGALSPEWRGSVFWARTGIILIQLWLGFPYMLLIITGALQGISEDMYEAADVDGAGPFRKFWDLTLPLLLVAVGPLLIASFAFNFNNFTVIQLYNSGNPTIATDSVGGWTDILITYTYTIAFAGGRGRDYGFATAITIVIFVLLTIVTLFNFQLTRRLEEISENV
jgi:arabinogalactan oligomer/maltooligosaccharide transport system permease protein